MRRAIDSGQAEGQEQDGGGMGESDATSKQSIGETHDVGWFGASRQRQMYTGGGRRSRSAVDKRGHYVRSSMPTGKIRAFNEIALDATIRAAATNRADNASLPPNDNDSPIAPLNILPTDYRVKVREAKVGNLILFVVDGSGSMAARKRMQAVKGSIMSLLLDAYQKRDHVGLITFRHRDAKLVLPPTNSTDLAQKYLSELPTGGRTPLTQAMVMTYMTLKKYRSDELVPFVILISDCRGNVLMGSKKQMIKPAVYLEESLRVCREIAATDVASLVIDCEIGRGRWNFAPRVANALGGDCVRIESLSADKLTQTVRSLM